VADFRLPDLNGKVYQPADFKGKVLLVNFWATWCGPCLIEIPWFLEFKERYGPEGFEVLAISMDEEGPEVVKPFVEKHKMEPLTVVMGSEDTPALFGGLLGFPTTFMVDRNGNYYSKHQGLVGKEDVEDEILILLRDSEAGQAAGTESEQSQG
jgi:cytochrome c biogenesis protein CcmG/thiol:disulfide interchange protein DsbE